ncbi:WbqC family protein [Saccharopolyspora phatthalungensis]|uniref:WbqC-like protein n=1 Tax=Saccharopolyspora phatthalungensis TaxID=664693 RepID=A0A840QJF0_9PSEU|nr:WbqC family protein [Saccharopolyspora phatthalungensis]MBB5159288.1 hypothetical protein [Saccharopolyspora phatthalungensis]
MSLHRKENHPPKVLVAHQPSYLPWQGYFARLFDVDQLVLLDHVQFAERGVQHRTWIRGHTGGRQRLSVPVRRTGRYPQPIRDVAIADPRWAHRHWRTLSQIYRRAKYFDTYAEDLHAIYHQPWTTLTAVNTTLIKLVSRALGLDIQLIPSSSLDPTGTKTAMLVDLCRRTGATVLRVGTGAPHYLDTRLLTQAGIAIEVATYTHHPYPQGRGPFVPNLAALDPVLHHGPHAREILAAGASTRTWTPHEHDSRPAVTGSRARPQARQTHSLMPLLTDRRRLKQAARGCMRTTSSPGADGMTWRNYRAGLDARLAKLAAHLHDGSWTPSPLRQVTWSLDDKDLAIVIPTVEDRIVHRALRQCAEPILEAHAYPDWLFGWRPGRSRAHALAYAQRHGITSPCWVADIDVTRATAGSTVDQTMRWLADWIHDGSFLRIVRRVLNGLPSPLAPGSGLSPLLTNL